MSDRFSMRARANGSAEILIYEDVGAGWDGGVTAKRFTEELKGLGAINNIDLRISSLGGDVQEGLAIYRQLVDHPAKVVAHVDGWAASIAAVIAMAGEEIRIAESGAIMIHNAAAIAFGGSDEMRTVADRLDATTAAIADIFVKRTGNSMQKVRDWMDAETWFYGEEAIEAGFATALAPNLGIAAKYDPSRHVFRNAPAALVGTPARDKARQSVRDRLASFTRSRASA